MGPVIVDRRVGVGVIGLGRFGRLHALTYAQSPLARLVAVTDVVSERADETGRELGVRAFTDYRYLLDDPEVEAVSIATPGSLHLRPAVEAAAAGKHLLVEKPLATTSGDGQAIVDAADTHRVVLMVGHVFRFAPQCAAVHEALSEGHLGTPLAITARLYNPIDEARYVGGSVSPLFHLAIHLIDLCLWYMAALPTRVGCVGVKGAVWDALYVLDGCVVTMEFARGGVATAQTFWNLPSGYAGATVPSAWAPYATDTALEVIGTDGVLYVDDMAGVRGCGRTGWMFANTVLRPIVNGRIRGALADEVEHFLGCCLGRQSPIVSGREAMHAVRVAEDAERALALGAPIRTCEGGAIGL